MARGEFRKSAQAHPQSFLLDEPASLDEFPRVVRWPLARTKRNLVDRYSSMLETDFAGGAAKVDERPAQRLRPDEDEPDRLKHLLRGGAVGGFVQVDHHVRAMKRNH